MARVVKIFLFSGSFFRSPSMSFRFEGIDAFASSGSHSSKMVAATLGKREGEALRASCMQPWSGRKTRATNNGNRAFFMMHSVTKKRISFLGSFVDAFLGEELSARAIFHFENLLVVLQGFLSFSFEIVAHPFLENGKRDHVRVNQRIGLGENGVDLVSCLLWFTSKKVIRRFEIESLTLPDEEVRFGCLFSGLCPEQIHDFPVFGVTVLPDINKPLKKRITRILFE